MPQKHTEKSAYNIIFDLGGVLFTLMYKENQQPLLSPIEQGINLLKQCAQQLDTNNQQLHRLFILSNCSTNILKSLEQDYPHIMSLFDGAVTSGQTYLEKPDPTIYLYLLNTYNLNPQHCVFIDDKESNVHAADVLGMRGIVCDDLKKVGQELTSLGIL